MITDQGQDTRKPGDMTMTLNIGSGPKKENYF